MISTIDDKINYLLLNKRKNYKRLRINTHSYCHENIPAAIFYIVGAWLTNYFPLDKH